MEKPNQPSRSSGNKLLAYARLMRLDKPIGIFLLLWPTLWALWIAGEGQVDPLVLGVFIAGVILMRSAGCVINDFADRNIDGHVERTKDRPLASGQLSSREALLLFVVLCLIAFALVLLMNWKTILLSIPAVVLAATYPFMKRHTYLPQVHLGAAFAMSVPMAYTAQKGDISAEAWLIYLATVMWTVAYDTIYAMMDREDDLKIGVKSTAILFGDADRFFIGCFQLAAVSALIFLGLKLELGRYYYLGLGGFSLLLIYQQVLIRKQEAQKCFTAFKNNHYAGLLLFLGLVAHYIWGHS